MVNLELSGEIHCKGTNYLATKKVSHYSSAFQQPLLREIDRLNYNLKFKHKLWFIFNEVWNCLLVLPIDNSCSVAGYQFIHP